MAKYFSNNQPNPFKNKLFWLIILKEIRIIRIISSNYFPALACVCSSYQYAAAACLISSKKRVVASEFV